MTTGELWSYWNKHPRAFRHWNRMTEVERRQLAEVATREYSKDLRYIRERMVEIEKGINVDQISVDVMDRFKSALYCHVNGQFHATIAVTGMAGEQISLELTGKVQTPQGRLGDAFARELNQDARLKLLRSFGAIDERVYEHLNKIRKFRNKHVHPTGRQNGAKEKADALECLRSLIAGMRLTYRRH